VRGKKGAEIFPEGYAELRRQRVMDSIHFWTRFRGDHSVQGSVSLQPLDSANRIRHWTRQLCWP
jgi:hypothetical protein